MAAELLPAESIALTVALAQVQRGEDPAPNTAALCVLALARLAGRHDWTEECTTGPRSATMAEHSEEIRARLFVSRPQYVEAVPWDGSNVAEVLAAIPDKTRYDRTTARMFLLAGGPWQQEWVPVPDGYWLVHPPGDLTDVWPVEDAFFQAKYEPVLFGSKEGDRG